MGISKEITIILLYTLPIMAVIMAFIIYQDVSFKKILRNNESKRELRRKAGEVKRLLEKRFDCQVDIHSCSILTDNAKKINFLFMIYCKLSDKEKIEKMIDVLNVNVLLLFTIKDD